MSGDARRPDDGGTDGTYGPERHPGPDEHPGGESAANTDQGGGPAPRPARHGSDDPLQALRDALGRPEAPGEDREPARSARHEASGGAGRESASARDADTGHDTSDGHDADADPAARLDLLVSHGSGGGFRRVTGRGSAPRPRTGPGPAAAPGPGTGPAASGTDETPGSGAATGSGAGSGPGSGSGRGSGAPYGSSPDDELALRRLLRQAVSEIEPDDGALERLRRAVPARRSRRRQATVGAAAAALLLGTAVPALIHVSRATGADDHPAIAGQASDSSGGTDGRGPGDGHGRDTGHGADSRGTGGKDDPGPAGSGAPSDGAAGGAPDPLYTAAVGAPSCGPAELGDASSAVGPPDAGGTVYGSFRVTNVSAAACTIDGGGSVLAVAQGSTDPAKVSVVDHTTGDAATGLPDPSQEPRQLVLEPGATYQVRFAWVPSAKCQADSGPTPDPSPSGDADGPGNSTSSLSRDGMSAQLLREDGASDGSVAVTHVAEPGAPSTGTTIPNACAGTLYRTGALPAP